MWAALVESINFASKNWEIFTYVVKSFNVSLMSNEMFDFLDSNGDSEVSKEELKDNWPWDGHNEEFFAEYWSIFDTDNSGTWNFEENMYYIAATCDGLARLMIKAFDENGNGILDGQETVKFKEEFDFDHWTDSQMDGDNSTGTKAEIVKFFMMIYL
jgi:Ca2+-binding EF-hand superfamily protein